MKTPYEIALERRVNELENELHYLRNEDFTKISPNGVPNFREFSSRQMINTASLHIMNDAPIGLHFIAYAYQLAEKTFTLEYFQDINSLVDATNSMNVLAMMHDHFIKYLGANLYKILYKGE